ncbi:MULTISPECIES: GNAT family N-acetyltransferase [Pseudomonas]|uniref:GNAT family N-acetyltransferase n=1 Tax=Pseudomonas TaxID=286 RepID=UPI00048A3973|nr:MULTISPECIES: GNAT family N-acetyltransferase [Pseudomonas]MBF6039223.1 GNAT family N-acetyltransferase [Pseudomonas mucoides]CRL52561.1 Acetyltransferase (GNAT) family protein [Pseudomonas sp. URMO17WK12:I11]
MITVKDPDDRASEAYSKVTGKYWIEALKDGRHVLIRQLTEKDREREYSFIKQLCPESRHMRFLTQINDPGNKQCLAYIALVHENGQLIEIGVSRYVATGEYKCECTVTVADQWKHLGLGTLLMAHLIRAARKNRFHQMYAVDASSNAPMRELARSLGFETRNDPFDTRQVIHGLYL